MCHVEKVVLMLSDALCLASNIFSHRNCKRLANDQSSVQVTVSPSRLMDLHSADVFSLSSVTLSVFHIGKGAPTGFNSSHHHFLGRTIQPVFYSAKSTPVQGMNSQFLKESAVGNDVEGFTKA